MTEPAPNLDYVTACAALEWLLELGADTAVGDTPVDRYALPESLAPARATPGAEVSAQGDAAQARGPASRPRREAMARPAEPMAVEVPDPVVAARFAAGRAETLEALRDEVTGFDLCELKKGAKTTVFADGNPQARVMLIGEAPGREENTAGRPFVGQAGQLLDRMFAAIGLSREAPDPASALYITNVLPWYPPGDRDPSSTEIAMMQPFLARHVELAAPDVLVLMGNAACEAVLGRRGILRMRGHWAEAWGRKVLPMTHPAYLLRQPQAKREAWADLLEIKAQLGKIPG